MQIDKQLKYIPQLKKTEQEYYHNYAIRKCLQPDHVIIISYY